MLSITWLMFLTSFLLSANCISSGEIVSCPKDCQCAENSNVAHCVALGNETFPNNILHLVLTSKNFNEPITLHDNIFANLGLEYLNSLTIKDVPISHIAENAFKDLHIIDKLSMNNCKISHINPNVFGPLSKLMILSLANNPLENLRFGAIMSLEELRLPDCNIKLDKDMFKNITSLQYLNLANNNINELSENVFSNLPYLEMLNLADNDISSMPPKIFKFNEEIMLLNLSNNPIKELYFDNQVPSEELILKSCDINRTDAKFGQFLNQLYNLDLSDNVIEIIEPGAFANMGELQYIDLSGNSLSMIDADIFAHNSDLERIILNDNEDLQIPVFKTNDTFVTYIFSCNNCGITNLHPDTFVAMSALSTLHLSNNMIEDVNNGVFTKLDDLSNLDLSYNQLTQINENVFAKNLNLMSLNLAGNPLKAISSNIFRSNLALQTLDISSCKLTNLWNGAGATLESLQTLKVANNSLTVINSNDISIIPNVKVLDITNNNISCTRELRNLIEWLTTKKIQGPDTADRVKTHEEMLGVIDVEEIKTVQSNDIWQQLAKDSCQFVDNIDDADDEDADSDEEDDGYVDNEVTDDDSDDENESNYFTKDIYDYDKTGKTDDDGFDTDYNEYDNDDEETDVNVSEIITASPKMWSGYMWPVLVFIFTALLVLVIVANVIMVLLKRRGTIDMPRGQLPHFKIQPWGTESKMKKHSGMVYRPLSEDISGPRTPMINRYAQVHNPSVHKPDTV